MTDIICGVDVSAKMLDARIGPDGVHARFERTPDGIAALAVFCRTQGVHQVAMEATGGYEQLPFALLWAEAIPCALLNPRMVRRFAEAMGILEKTDRIDAGVIAWYAQVKRIVPQPPATDTQKRLTALVTRLGQFTRIKIAQANQRRLVDDPDVLASFEPLAATVAEQSRILEAHIAATIAADPLWRELDKAFREIKGVADRAVARCMADIPEIGTISGKAIAKLVGLAPIARDSGPVSGKRFIRGGRADVRSLLVFIARIVRRYDPDFAAFHKRLMDEGKPLMVANVALARKLIVRLNAKAKDVRNRLAAQNAAPEPNPT